MGVGRRVITERKGKVGGAGAERGAAPEPPVAGKSEYDGYVEKVALYIPAEIIAAWVAITGFLAGSAQASSATLNWIIFIALLIITPFYVWRGTLIKGEDTGKLAAKTQIVVSTVAFAVWIFALGGPFKLYSWYAPIYGSLALVFFSLVSGLINQPLPAPPRELAKTT